MKIETFKNKIKQIEDYGIQKFIDPSFDGSCPCFDARKQIEGYTLFVWGRCWRVSEKVQDLNIGGDLPKKELKEIAELIKERLDKQEWHNPYTIIYRSVDWFEGNNI